MLEPVVEEEEVALGRFSGSAAARTTRARAPTWFVVRSPTTRMPRAWAASTSDDERVVAAEQRVDGVERRRVVAVRAAGGKDGVR